MIEALLDIRNDKERNLEFLATKADRLSWVSLAHHLALVHLAVTR